MLLVLVLDEMLQLATRFSFNNEQNKLKSATYQNAYYKYVSIV